MEKTRKLFSISEEDRINKKIDNIALFKGYISTKGISAILTLNAPKCQRSAGIWKFASNATFSSTEAPLD